MYNSKNNTSLKPLYFIILLSLLLSPYLSFGDFGIPIIIIILILRYGEVIFYSTYRNFIRCFCLVYMLCMLNSIVYSMFGVMELKYALRGISTSINSILFFLMSFVFLLQYKKKLFDYLSISFLLAYSIVVFNALIEFGFSEVLESVFAIFSNGVQSTGFETDSVLEAAHGILLTTPLLSIIYIYSYLEKKERRLLVLGGLLLIVSLMAYKRIAIGAMFVIAILYLLRKKINSFLIVLSGLISISLMLFFIAIIKNDFIYELCYVYDIDLMFRDRLWPAFSNYYDFSINFYGQGWDFITKFLQENNQRIFGNNIGGLHNDILKIYIDFGFIGSIIYWSFFLILIPLNLLKKGEKDAAFFYWLCQIYFIIIYTTDNALIYLPSQLAANVIPLVHLKKIKC